MTSPVFAEHLSRYGPNRKSPAQFTLDESKDYCRQLAQQHYENFVVGSLFLPVALRAHFYSLYAWCRWADDLADETTSAEESLRLLDWWEDELYALYAGRPQQIVTLALRETVAAFEIPIDPFLDLLVAFRRDQRQSRFDTDAELLDYCRYSANPVGRLVLYLGGVFSPDRAWLADSICTGLQLANFWQDLARDWQRGRLYLPRETLFLHGVSEAELARREATPALRQLLAAETRRAEELLLAGLPLVEQVPSALRLEVELFARGGLAICAAIRRQNYDVWRKRPTVSKWTQLRLLAGCWWRQRAARGTKEAS